MMLLKTTRPIIIDTGFGSDINNTIQLIEDSGISPQSIDLIVNTHYHTDHTGGNGVLQQRYNLPIAAHRWEADLINSHDVEACGAKWLDQPIEPYHVDHFLSEGDIIQSGDINLEVIHTPGHSLGHLSFYEHQQKIMISGDLFQLHDVGWLNMFREGVGALHKSIESLEKIKQYDIHVAYPGHGPAIYEPDKIINKAITRYEKWLKHPEKMAWHGCKRIFAYALMIRNGIHKNDLADYLLNRAWFQDYSLHMFAIEAKDFINPFIKEMLRSGAATWKNDILLAKMHHLAPPTDWNQQWIFPEDWE